MKLQNVSYFAKFSKRVNQSPDAKGDILHKLAKLQSFKICKNCKTSSIGSNLRKFFFVQILVSYLYLFLTKIYFLYFLAVPMTNTVPWVMSTTSSPLRSSVSMEVDLSVTPFRRWKKCHFNSNPNRRFSSAASSGGHGSQRFQMTKIRQK